MAQATEQVQALQNAQTPAAQPYADPQAPVTSIPDGDITGHTAGVGQDGVGVHIRSTQVGTGALTRTATEIADPELLRIDYDKEIVKMQQSGVPIDQICRQIRQVPIKSVEFNHFAVDTPKVQATVTSATQAGSPGAIVSVTVDDSSVFYEQLEVVIPSHCAYEADGTATSIPFVGYVTEVPDGTTIKIMALNGEPDATTGKLKVPALSEGDAIYRVAPALSELDIQTVPYAVLPTPRKLTMQKFGKQVMESTISAEAAKNVDWSMRDQTEMALYDMRREIETAYVFGHGDKFRDPRKRSFTYTCSGIIEQIVKGNGNVLSYDRNDATFNHNTLMTNIIQPIFLNNNGSSKRYLFAGSKFISFISEKAELYKHQDANSVAAVFGIDWNVIQFMSWRLNLIHYPLLDQYGMEWCAFVLDLPNVVKGVYRSIREDRLNLIEAGLADANSTVWQEISAIILKYPQCHAFIYDVNSYNPQ